MVQASSFDGRIPLVCRVSTNRTARSMTSFVLSYRGEVRSVGSPWYLQRERNDFLACIPLFTRSDTRGLRSGLGKEA